MAIQVHEERDGIGPVADGDLMKVIGHQGLCGDPNLALFAERADEGEEMMAVLVGDDGRSRFPSWEPKEPKGA